MVSNARVNGKSVAQRVYGWLKSNPGAHCRDVADALGMTRYASSHALKQLHAKGCVNRHSRSQATHYTVTTVKPSDDRGIAAGTHAALSVKWKRRGITARANPRRLRSACLLEEVWR